MSKNNNKVVELCGYCCQEVEIDAVKCKLQKCPNCGKPIRACCLCDMDTCDCSECEKKNPSKKYARCRAYYEWQVMVDNKVMCRENDKQIAQIMLDHFLREKKYDNVYMIKITRVRYTLLED